MKGPSKNINPAEIVSFDKIKWRYEPRRWRPIRFKTIPEWDNISGGLPNSLTVFYGPPGSGKSLLARSIAKAAADKGYTVIYLICESLSDSPIPLDGQEDEYIHIGDYTRHVPRWDRAFDELWIAQTHFEANLIIVDSATRFFSGTAKAVEEADIRSALWRLAKEAENRKVSIIAISEIRGSGNYTYPAGGHAVDHAASLLVRFDKLAANRWDARDYGIDVGEKLYLMEIEKDKHGLADSSSLYVVEYPQPFQPKFKRFRDYVKERLALKEKKEQEKVDKAKKALGVE